VEVVGETGCEGGKEVINSILIKQMMNNKFEYFAERTGIEIPQNVLNHYLNGKNSNSEFVRLFKSQIDDVEKTLNPDLSILVSENFAKEILKLIYEFSYEERTTILFKDICHYNNYEENIKFDTSIEDFVIEEILYTVVDYSYKENKFKFPLVQKAYETIGSNTEEIKVVLVLWAHCGGQGGIIIRGKNIGFDSFCVHTDYSEVEFNGKNYSYKGFPSKEYERLHKPILENHQ